MYFLVLVICPNRASQTRKRKPKWFAVLASLLFQAYLQVWGEGEDLFSFLPTVLHLTLPSGRKVGIIQHSPVFFSRDRNWSPISSVTCFASQWWQKQEHGSPRTESLGSFHHTCCFSLPTQPSWEWVRGALFKDVQRTWFITPSCHPVTPSVSFYLR